jgi:hypothetical protein
MAPLALSAHRTLNYCTAQQSAQLDNNIVLPHLTPCSPPFSLPGAGNEILVFSGYVDKINAYGKSQKRVLIITDRGLYNVDNSKCKRRIDLQSIAKIVRSAAGHQFVLNVPEVGLRNTRSFSIFFKIRLRTGQGDTERGSMPDVSDKRSAEACTARPSTRLVLKHLETSCSFTAPNICDVF